MSQPPDPRTFATRKLAASDWLVVTNSDVAWSATTAATYMAARGIPGGNTVAVALGTNPLTFDPGSNANIATNIVAPILAALEAKGALGILLAPGCPAKVLVRGRVSATFGYQPALNASPPLFVLASAVRCYADRLANAGGTLVALGDSTFTNVQWAGTATGTPYQALFPFFLWRMLGTGTQAEMSPAVPLSSTFPSSATFLATTLATQTLSVTSDQVPVGRIGASAWTALAVPESASNALDGATSATAALALTSQPAPILLALRGPYQDAWAALYERAADWGYPVKYHWRTTPSGTAATLCPAGGADEAFTNAQLTGGSVVDYGYYVYGGVSENSDDPETLAPFSTALLPADGGTSWLGGFSDAWMYAARNLTRGGAGGGLDQSHRTAASIAGTWPVHYLLMAGLSQAEAAYYSGFIGSACPAGDPLHAPWHFDPGPDAGGGASVSSGARPVRRWANRRLRARA